MKQDFDLMSDAKVARAVNLYIHIYKKERAIRNNEKKLEMYLDGLTPEEAEAYAERTTEWDETIAKSYDDWQE